MSTFLDALTSLPELSAAIVDARTETEALRRVPHSIGTALAETGYGRLLLPTDLGGHELEPDSWLGVMEELGAADASVGLVVWNNCLPALVSRHLGNAARQEIFANPLGLYANSSRPSGRATPTDGGHTITGRWSLVTGCDLAEWFFLMCFDEGKNHGGAMIMAAVPAAAVEIIDTWHAVGVRGSGSHDVVVTGVEIPRAHMVDFMSPNLMTDRPIGRMPWTSLMAAGNAAISLGLAREASAAFVRIMSDKTAVDTGAAAIAHPGMQLEFIEADEAVHAARVRLLQCIDAVWQRARDAQPIELSLIADVYASARYAGTVSKRLTEVVYERGGTSSVYTGSIIEAAWRDVHAVNQHVIVSPMMAEQAARVRLGLEPTVPLFSW